MIFLLIIIKFKLLGILFFVDLFYRNVNSHDMKILISNLTIPIRLLILLIYVVFQDSHDVTLQIILTDKALLQSMQIESFDLNRRSEEIILENKRLEGLFSFLYFIFFIILCHCILFYFILCFDS